MTDRHSRLAHYVSGLRQATVVCVGDVMLDRFVGGSVDRISPEAPIPVLRVTHETAMLGGASNVVRNLVGVGARVGFVSVVGDDDCGRQVADLLAALDRVEPTLQVEPGRRTPLKVRFLAGNQQLLRADHETVRPIAEAEAAAVLTAVTAALRAAAGGGRVLVLSDYGKGVLTDPLIARLIAVAAAEGVAVVVDPKGRDFGRYRGATLVTPNRKELAEATGLPTDGDAAVVAACRKLIATAGVQGVLATRSQHGMTLVTGPGGTEVTHLPAEAREVFDVSGAGDTVVAVLAAALAAGVAAPEAAELANVAAGIVVGKVGTAAVHASELIDALHKQDLHTAEAKILPIERAAEQVEGWRRRALSVGFTNGCFDLLHPGHLSLLRQARKACDRLVVGVNADASVKRLKGAARPIQGEAARAAVLAALSMVDAVVIFEDDTPLALIRALRPDVLVKGADYTVETVVGAAEVQAWGGRVVLADLEPEQSTTATIGRMARP